MKLYLDISPNTIASSRSEPRDAPNRLVLQIRNLSEQDVTLHNDTGKTDYDFKPLSKAEGIEGLTMIYFVFCLGSSNGCLTTEEHFNKATLSSTELFTFKRVGRDTLVFFPTKTTELSPCDLTELVINNLVTDQPPGTSSLCTAVFFDGFASRTSGRSPIHIIRHPLQIPDFEVAKGHGCASFRDMVRFHYLVMGADSCIFTPGDMPLAKNAYDTSKGSYDALLYSRTMYTLVAEQGNQKISRSFEVIPLTAEILSFSAEVKQETNGTFTATLKFSVKNTRHAFLSFIGRIEVENGVEQTVTCCQAQREVSYTLSVENANGLTQAVCRTK